MNIFKSKFFVVYLLTFINGLSFSMLIPVEPFLIKLYNQKEIVLGILIASYSFFQLFGAPFMGALSDKYGRKPILLLTQFGTFLSWIILGLAYFIPNENILGYISLPIFVFFLSRMVDGITGGNISVANAMISDISTKKERTIIYGRNGAIIGITLTLGPSLGAFSMSSSLGYLGTAILGGLVSFIAFIIMIFVLKESLKENKRKKELEISFKNLNLFSQLKKRWSCDMIRFVVYVNVIMYSTFIIYTTISTLYLIDVFEFSPLNVGYYLIITGSFLFLHQSYSLSRVVKKIGDLKTVIVGQAIMSLGYIGMGLSGNNLYLYTMCYFFAILGISLSWTPLKSIFTSTADEKSQGEIMGISSGIESFVSIILPIIGTVLYSISEISIFLIIGIFPIFSIIIYFSFFRNKLKEKSLETEIVL